MKYTIPLVLIELETASYHIAVKSLFHDQKEGLWIIDTGASKTVFNRLLTNYFDVVPAHEEISVRSAGIGSDHLETSTGLLHPFYLGDLRTGPMKVALLDLSHINTFYYHATEREICGLIGSDFLMKNKAFIDYGKLRMILHSGKDKRNRVSLKVFNFLSGYFV